MNRFWVTKRVNKVAVIGSGMSLKDVDFATMNNDGYTICVNDAWRKFKNPDLVVTGDTKKLDERFLSCPQKVVVVHPSANPPSTMRAFLYMQRRDELGLSEDCSTIHSGENSGYIGIGVAYLMRPTHMFFFGLDLTNMADHCHEHYSVGVLCPKLEARLPQNFATLYPKLSKINVINGSLISKIPSFRKTTPEEAIEIWNSIG